MSHFYRVVEESDGAPHLRDTAENASAWMETIATRLGAGPVVDFSRHQFLAGATTASKLAFQTLLKVVEDVRVADPGRAIDVRYVMFDANQRALLRCNCRDARHLQRWRSGDGSRLLLRRLWWSCGIRSAARTSPCMV